MPVAPLNDETNENRPGPSLFARVARVVIIAIVLALLLGGLWFFNEFRKGMIAKFLAGSAPPPAAVVTVVAKTATVEHGIDAIGSLQAVRQVTIAPEIGGRVTAIRFEPGATVRAGDPLVQLDDESERATLASQRAAARLADITLDRAVDLRRTQAGAQATVDTARAQNDQAQADLRKTEVTIDQKRIKAPFDGDLGVRRVNLGDYVSPGTALVTLTDLSQLYVNFTLPEQNRGKVVVGQEIRISIAAYPQRVFEARVTTIDPQVNADTRTLHVQGIVDNTDRALQPGMFANVRLMLAPEANVIVLPSTAVDYSLYGDSVYVVREAAGEDGKTKMTANRVSVGVGERSGDSVAIRRGVKAGDRIVATGQVKLNNGAAVTLSDEAPPKSTAAPSTY